MRFSVLIKILVSRVRKLLLVGSVAAVPYVGICVWLYFKQTHLMFFPSAVISKLPSEVGLSYEEVWLPIHDGSSTRIHGWWIPTITQERGVVLYLHGNGGNIGSNVEHAKRFHSLGLSVLLIDYEGYGKSQGMFPSENTVYRDAAIAWNHLTQERRIAPERIILYGHSLGGAIAIQLALQQPRAAGLIVQGSFTSMREMADRTTRYAFLPIDLILTQHFDSISKVPQLQMPVLFIHGLADEDVPYDMSETLYAAAPDPKWLWLVPEAAHNDVARVAGRKYFETIEQFLLNAGLHP